LEVLGVFWGSWVIVVFALYAANTHVAQWTYNVFYKRVVNISESSALLTLCTS
jgi:ABC-type phosphate/phosphonate transport system permease subunit